MPDDLTPPAAASLTGRRVLVTGASRGIGAAVAHAVASAGGGVALTARDAEALERLAGEIIRSGPTAPAGAARAVACPADATDGAAVEACVERASGALGGLDSIVLCQGVNRLGPIRAMDDAAWDEVLAVNLTASFRLLRAFLGHARPPGAVVAVSSVSGLPGYRKYPGFAAYCASKRGLLGLAEVLDVEESGRGFRVYAVCPRGVDTEMFRQAFPGATPELTPAGVAGRIAELLAGRGAPHSGAVIEL